MCSEFIRCPAALVSLVCDFIGNKFHEDWPLEDLFGNLCEPGPAQGSFLLTGTERGVL